MNIPCDIADFVQSVGAGGSISITNKVAVISSPASISTRLDKNILADPGCLVEFSVFARATSGGGGSMTIDYLPIDRGGDVVRITSTEWREYRAAFTVPLNVPDDQRITFGIGNFGADPAGAARFHSPRIDVKQTLLGSSRVMGRGLVVLTSGVPSLNGNYQRDGIGAMSYDAPTATLSLTMRGNNGSGLRLFPQVFCQPTGENTNTAWRQTLARPTGYDSATGIVTIQFTNASTGAIQDVAGLGTVSLHVKAEI